ncbi:sodium- and chloride-dependent glycine transporter 1-like isoform X1 [Pectinophora gossypiella]|uniref:sodium- and chloride-dependent glycine transporter 1-like isoform X1 n=1 Tax=Pectinophora gossypiella TaxID=13191 RepID=UPI00214E395B|nr:sodium- and chloride-dependent glycine transporter 1-like isoform X1 [Pectinophora gossypiella]
MATSNHVVNGDEKFARNSYLGPLDEPAPTRASWGRPLEFILACLGYAVGLGNVWRFPYLCYRNGGGAFLIPFFLMLVFIGLPLFYLELYIGQYTGMGPLDAFTAISPFFTGLGYCTMVVISIVSIYYMVIVAWTLFYTIVSIAGYLDWGSCFNDYNTDFCYSGSYDKGCRENNTGAMTDRTFFRRTCVSIGEICTITNFQPLNGTHCLNNTEPIVWYTGVTRTLASEEYYNERVLGRGDATWENWGSIQWHLVGTLFLSWLIAFFCVIKGVQSAGKVVYFTALFPYVMLTALLVRGVTLEGASDGIFFYLLPDWEILLEPKVWGDAASQIFYSFGIACGSLITLASYNNFTNNCHFDAVFVSFANFFTSIYAGFAIFSVLGFQAQLMGVSVDDVAEEGPGLAFVTYPEALLQMPVPQLWSILFFLMLFILGLGSQFAGIEAVNTAIVDRWPHLRKCYWRVTAFTCTSFFILGLPMCFSGGVYLFTLLDWNTASWAILLIGTAECAAVGWSYGIRRAIDDLAAMNMKMNKVLRVYWMTSWTVIVPLGSIAILGFIFSDWKPPAYESYVFPLFADLLGWGVGLSTLIFFPVGIAWAWFNGYRGKTMFSPTDAWKPANGAPAPRSDSIVSVTPTRGGPYDNLGYVM